MTTPDIINGAFEAAGAIAAWFNIAALTKHKAVKGFSPVAYIYFTAWGAWNLWYYPSLHQFASFVGALLIVLSNGLYTGLAVYYTFKQRRTVHDVLAEIETLEEPA